MGANYVPVLWNRQKRKYDTLMFGLILLYLLVFIGLQAVIHPEITAETMIIRATGTLAFLMLHVILSIGPVARLNPGLLPLLYNRRHLGVTMFFIALIHGAFNLIQLHALGDVDPLTSLFTSNIHYNSFRNFPFQVLGFFALLILFLMAATSHDFWLKNLGPKVWKSLHMCVYLSYFLLVMHVLLGVGQLETSPVRLGLTLFGMVIVTGFHVAAAIKVKRQESGEKREGNVDFVKVCSVDDIKEGRAKILQVNDENIAIFKYDGKLSAVSNMCRHQHGPLGEGIIVDGCITCPWHGYQYFPHNGQSPPPFTEKLETYDVKVEDGKVYVNPLPYMEGTERKPALL